VRGQAGPAPVLRQTQEFCNTSLVDGLHARVGNDIELFKMGNTQPAHRHRTMPDSQQLFSILKAVHMLTVLITIVGFVIRGIWMMRGSPLLNTRPVRIVPHINDTLLLISAVSAAAILGQYPFVDTWLTAKMLGLTAYILLGAVALTYGPTRRIRISAYAGALLSFTYVITVAFTKNPLIF